MKKGAIPVGGSFFVRNLMESGVFWPETTDPLFPLVSTYPFPSSDHRFVWIDLDI